MADDSFLLLAIVLAGAVVAGTLARSRPLGAVAVLFLLASLSRFTVETPIGAMRLEQPAIGVVAVVLTASRGLSAVRRVPRSVAAMGIAFAVYLVVLLASSVLIAPDRATSVRLVLWLAISMAGGAATFVLVRERPVDSLRPLAAVGATKGATGLVVALVFLVAGPSVDPGIQEALTIAPRVHAFTWEANLYASFLAMCIPLAIERARQSRSLPWLTVLIVVVLGLPLGETRGANIGALAGVATYAAIVVVRGRQRIEMTRWVGATVGVFAVGLLLAGVLLPNIAQRPEVDVAGGPRPTLAVQGSAGSPSSGAGHSPPPASTPSPTPTLRPYPDTVSFRLDRIPIALADLPTSPWIGLGAESFGQRHGDPSQAGAPDHIAILAVAAVYDAGIVGASALAMAFVSLLLGLWRARGAGFAHDPAVSGTAAAFAGTIVAMLVAYQATNALHFAINWILIGAAAALIAGPSAAAREVAPSER